MLGALRRLRQLGLCRNGAVHVAFGGALSASRLGGFLQSSEACSRFDSTTVVPDEDSCRADSLATGFEVQCDPSRRAEIGSRPATFLEGEVLRPAASLLHRRSVPASHVCGGSCAAIFFPCIALVKRDVNCQSPSATGALAAGVSVQRRQDVVRSLPAARPYNGPAKTTSGRCDGAIRRRREHVAAFFAARIGAHPVCQAVLGRHLTPRLGASLSSDLALLWRRWRTIRLGGSDRQEQLSPAASAGRCHIECPQARLSGWVHEPIPGTPLLLLEQHATKLGRGFRADVIERPEEAFAIFDGECDHFAIERERILVGPCRLVHERDELADVLVGNPQAGEIHGGEGTQAGRWWSTAGLLVTMLTSAP